jgi:multidrug efflux pump
MGVAIVGGLLLSQLITLFVTPVLYVTFDRVAQRMHTPRPAPDLPPATSTAS